MDKWLTLIFGYPVIIHVHTLDIYFNINRFRGENNTSMEQCLQTIHKQKEREDPPFKEKKKSAAYTNPQSAGMALTKDSFERIKWLITAAW